MGKLVALSIITQSTVKLVEYINRLNRRKRRYSKLQPNGIERLGPYAS